MSNSNHESQDFVTSETPAKKIGKFDKFFGISKSGSNFRTEIIAGIVTFLAMAYILTLNPILMLSGLVDEKAAGFNPALFAALQPSVFIATALGAFIGTLLMALLAKLPLAQAPGLGLNSMVGGLLGGSLGFVCNFGNALLLVFISGILFLLLSVITIKGISIRELIFNGIPECVRTAVSVGIGLFIAFIGLSNAGIITVGNGTLVGLVDFTKWDMSVSGGAIVCIFGFIIIAVLSHFNVKGSVIIGIIAATLLGIPLGQTKWSGLTWEFWTYFENFFSMNASNGGSFLAIFTEGFKWVSGTSIISLVMTIITFCMIDMFDTMGTCVGCCSAAGLLDENGKPVRYNRIMYSDSIATCTGALLGTSTVTTFVESGAGVSAGGKTGLTALTTALLFLFSILLLPLFASIPSSAASCALIWVGCLMLKGIKNVKVDSVKNTVPTFLTIAMMPLGYSITTGIGFGILSYVAIDLCEYIVKIIGYACSKKEDKVKPKWDLHAVTIIIGILFLIYFFVPTTF